MSARKIRLAGLGALLAMSVAAAGGCGVADAVKDEAAPQLTPQDLLLKSLPDAKTGSFRFSMTGGEVPAAGEIDTTRHSYRVGFRYTEPEAGFTLLSDYLVVEDESWVKISFKNAEGLTGLPKLPKKWMRIDPAKITDKKDVPVAYDDETDPGQAGVVLRAAAAVEQSSAGLFAGTTDLTQQGEAEFVDAATVKALGERAAAVPFEASVDGQGRLTTLVVKVPAAGKAKASRYELKYRDYGTTPAPEVPTADQQQKATKAAYDLLNA